MLLMFYVIFFPNFFFTVSKVNVLKIIQKKHNFFIDVKTVTEVSRSKEQIHKGSLTLAMGKCLWF